MLKMHTFGVKCLALYKIKKAMAKSKYFALFSLKEVILSYFSSLGV
jgi:hypothetical protein